MQRKDAEKAAILEIVKISEAADYSKRADVEKALSIFKKKEILSQTEFAKRYLSRLETMLEDEEMFGSEVSSSYPCILCGRNEEAGQVVCRDCMENILPAAQQQTQELAARKESQAPTGGMEEMQDYLTKQMRLETRISTKYTDDLVRNLDSTMDRLAKQSSMRSMNRMLAAVLAISLINTCAILGIFILLMFR